MTEAVTITHLIRSALFERRRDMIDTHEIAVSPKAFRELRHEDPPELEHHPCGTADGTVAYTFRGIPLMQDVRVGRFTLHSKEQRA